MSPRNYAEERDVAEQAADHARAQRRIWSISVLLCLGTIGLSIVADQQLLGIAISGLLIGAGMIAGSTRRLPSAYQISQLRDPATLDDLLTAAFEGEGEISDAAWRSLDRVLPQAERAHSHLLSKEGRARVVKLLTTNNLQLVRIALEACKRLEITEAVPTLRLMAASGCPVASMMGPSNPYVAGSPIELMAAWPQVREGAGRALAVLEPLLESQQDRDTLLRPSEPDHASELLRPAAFAPEDDPELLLRPKD